VIIVVIIIAILIGFIVVFEQPTTVAKVRRLFIYPVKSCGGIEVRKAEVTEFGFAFDRMFMVVDLDGHFVSQRIFPQMVLIRPELDLRHSKLILHYEGMSELQIDLEDHPVHELLKVRVWQDEVEAIDMGEEAAQWFSEILEEDVKLVKMDPYAPRKIKAKLDDAFGGHGRHVSFADKLPFMMVSEGSLLNLNDHLHGTQVLEMERFRPNVVIRGCLPFAEDEWKDCTIGNLHVAVTDPCSRCKMITIDPRTGTFDEEDKVRTALKSFRKGEHIGLEDPPSMKEQIFFGQRFALREKKGFISIGDEVCSMNI
jgi:hypothetical protein